MGAEKVLQEQLAQYGYAKNMAFEKGQSVEQQVLSETLQIANCRFKRGIVFDKCTIVGQARCLLIECPTLIFKDCVLAGDLILAVDEPSGRGEEANKIIFMNSVITKSVRIHTKNFLVNVSISGGRIEGEFTIADSQVFVDSETQIGGNAKFVCENSRVRADFHKTIVEGAGQILLERVLVDDYVLLSGISLSDKAQINFHRMAMDGVIISRISLVKILFDDVDWPVNERGLRATADDMILRGKKLKEHLPWDWRRLTRHDVTELYRNLINQFELRREFELAEDFYVNEMELRRTRELSGARRKLVRRSISAVAIYRFASLYGSSYSRAAKVLLALLLTFSIAFMFNGFTTPKRSDLVVDYSNGAYLAQLNFPSVISDIGTAISLTLSIATLQKDKPAVPVGASGSFLASAATLLLTAQGALLLFALRRRLRRSSI